jgi:hypothetical protein
MATQQQQQRISQVRLLQYSQERARQFKLSIRRSFELYTRLSKSGAGGRRRKNKKRRKEKAGGSETVVCWAHTNNFFNAKRILAIVRTA